MEQEKYQTALHEAAHAVVQFRVTGDFCGEVSIVPGNGNLGFVTDYSTDSSSPEDLQARVLSCFAGGEADRLIGCFNEHAVAGDEEAASECLALLGISNAAEIDALRKTAGKIVKDNWSDIQAVANELVLHETLDDTEVVSIIEMQNSSDPDTVKAGLDRYRADFLNR